MITEDYVSFETAKLLKEKGFEDVCHAVYDKDGIFINLLQFVGNSNFKGVNEEKVTFAPTLQMAMKWLREIHSLEIYPYHDYMDGNEKWWFEIIRFRSSYAEHESGSIYLKYEDACEAAIKYCLENLI